MKKKLTLLIATGAFMAFGNLAFAHKAHEHGVAHMNFAIDGKEVKIELETPLANVLSFEHAPETDAQIQEVLAMSEIMHKADTLFVFPEQAKCRVEKISLESDAISDRLLVHGASGHSEKAHAEEKKHGEAHAGEDKHEEAHADLDVEISFQCLHPEKIDSVTVNLFTAFPHMHEIEVQMVTPKGQKAMKLTPASNTLRW